MYTPDTPDSGVLQNVRRNGMTSSKHPENSIVLCVLDKDGEWTKLGKNLGGEFGNPVFALDNDGPQ